LQKMYETKIPTSNFLLFSPGLIDEPQILPPRIWDRVDDIAFSRGAYRDETRQFIRNQVIQQSFLLQEDVQKEGLIRRRVQASVPLEHTPVEAGRRILDQGDRITARHLAMLKSMKEVLKEQKNLWHPLTFLGSFIFALALATIGVAFLRLQNSDLLRSNRKLLLIVTVIILTFALAKSMEFFLISNASLSEWVRYPLFVPFAAILFCHLIGPFTATLLSGILTIILALTLSFQWQGFIILNLFASLVAILSARSLLKRKEIFVVCGKAWLASVGLVITLNLYHNALWDGFFADVMSLGIFLLLTAVLVVGLLPLLESVFHIMTDISLMEYMDPNQDLLRRLSLEAPGTYQHSVVLGNLAEAAAQAIGANGLFCRVAAMYHDIGKLATPQYFTENQGGGVSPHQLLTPEESSQAIIAHVAEGVALARKADLPPKIIRIILEHHGTTPAKYFLEQQIAREGGDPSKVDIDLFRYAGPKPHTKEAAILMIADSLEAATRSLEEVDERAVRHLVRRIIRDKLDDGQFDCCPMTLAELKIVEDVLVKTIVASSHLRIKYPETAGHTPR